MVMDMTTIYLVRHAEAEGNLCRRMHGQYDSNLTPNGLRQLQNLKKRFEDIRLDACYSSDLTRAENTAYAICGKTYRVDPGFREVGVGEWEDLPFGYLNTFYGLKMTQFGKDPVNWKVEGSESFRFYTKRFLESMEQAALRHEGGVIAIVSHSVVMRGVLTALFPEEKIPHSANTAVSCLEYESGTYRVKFLNDCSHIDPKLLSSSRQKWWQQDGAQGDDTFWFQSGLTELDGLTPPESPITYTVLENQRPVGVICISEEGESTGRVDYLGLIPAYRGHGLSIQMLGQAMFVVRAMGKKHLVLKAASDPAMEALCRKLAFRPADDDNLQLDLTLRIQEF